MPNLVIVVSLFCAQKYHWATVVFCRLLLPFWIEHIQVRNCCIIVFWIKISVLAAVYYCKIVNCVSWYNTCSKFLYFLRIFVTQLVFKRTKENSWNRSNLKIILTRKTFKKYYTPRKFSQWIMYKVYFWYITSLFYSLRPQTCLRHGIAQ